MKYTVGLDLGITSIGWAAIGLDEDGNSTHIIDANVTILESIEDEKGELSNVKRREARGIRRTIRRRAFRVKRVKDLLEENGVKVDSVFNQHNKIQLNPYSLKTKGLKSELSKEELAICLIHYAKHRGFKSNRKNENVGEDGVLVGAIGKNKELLNEYNVTVSEFLYNNYIENPGEKIKNTDSEYKYLFDRETYEVEINMLLDKQIEFGVIDQKFKEKYIDIWSSQRDFSEGPGQPSKYAVDFSKSFGYCKFEVDGERHLRAPKCAPTTEIFRLLQKLNNIEFSFEGESKLKLRPDEIEKIYEFALEKQLVKYNDIKKIIKKDVQFNGLDLSKDSFIKTLNKYKEKYNIPKEENIDFSNEEFKKMIDDEKNKIVVAKLDNYKLLKKYFEKTGYISVFESMPVEYLDDIVTCLTFYKTDNRIKNYFISEGEQEHTKLDWDLYPQIVNEVIPEITTFNESSSLSLELMRKLNKLLIQGMDYTESMKELGLDHSKIDYKIEKGLKLPEFYIIEREFPNELTNPRVRRVLSATMAIINSLIDKYGMPTNIHIETARDIANKSNKRNKILYDNLDNFANNERLKFRIANEFKLKPANKVTKADLERLKLYEEQDGICMYSGEKIPEDMIFSTNLQVDHIIPYSKSYNNSYNNKTLVYTKHNQEKKNRIPYEYIKQDKKEFYPTFVNLVEGNYKISKSKKMNYLAKEIDEEFKSRSLNDTSFITTYFIKILKTFLDIDEKNIVGYKAGIVSSLKKSWDLQYLTHSIISDNYKSYDVAELKEPKIDTDGIKLIFESNFSADDIVIEAKKAKEKDKMNDEELIRNEYIDIVLNNLDVLNDICKKNERGKMFELFDATVKYEGLNKKTKSAYVYLMNYLNIEYSKQQIKKNRSNHFHHVLDAVCVGVLNRKYEINVGKFYQKIEEIKETAYENFKNNKVYVFEDTGAVVDNDDELNKELELMWKSKFPMPYENFDLETKIRIYEQNQELQKEKMNEIFNDDYTRNIRPVFPVYKPVRKRTMKLHKETFLGSQKFEDGEYLTKRVSVDTIDMKKVAKIVEVKKGKKEIESTFIEWIKNGKNGYPLLSNGRPIKKVKIVDKEMEKSIRLSDGKYAAIDKVARIDIYKSKNDEKLYFVQRNPVNMKQEELGEDFYVQLWWGRDKNNSYIPFSELSNYIPYKKITAGHLIELEMNNGSKTLCYTCGFSSGMLEIRSVIGDGSDLISNNFSGKVKKQYYVTISTIKSIEKVKINNLGEIGKRF